MKDAVKAGLPVISGVTYSVELRSGSIIAKVTLTGVGANAVAAEQVKTTVTATPLSVTVSGQPSQTLTSTGVVLVNVPINAASMALTLSCKYSTLGLVLTMLGLALS
jgi:BarA-like signal transduction histidine kinase